MALNSENLGVLHHDQHQHLHTDTGEPLSKHQPRAILETNSEQVLEVGKVPNHARKGHLVIAPGGDSEYSMTAIVAPALVGAFCTTPQNFIEDAEGLPRGVQYMEKCKSPKQNVHVAVSGNLAKAMPSLKALLFVVAEASGGSFMFAEASGDSFMFYRTKKNFDKCARKAANATAKQTATNDGGRSAKGFRPVQAWRRRGGD